MRIFYSILSLVGILFFLLQCGPGIGPIPNILCSDSTSWVTIEDWVPYPGTTSQLIANGMALNASGSIFYVTTANGGALPRQTALVRKSDVTGTQWSTVDTFTYGVNSGAQNYNIWTDGAQSVFLQGAGWDVSGIRHWLVRRSEDAGATWSTADDFQLNTAFDSIPGFNNTPALMLPNGDWLVQGQGDDATSTHLLVRKSTDRGATWSTVFNYQYQAGYATGSRTLVRDAFGVLYMGAQGLDSAGSTHWLVLKSTDSGISWGVVDDYVHGVGRVSGVKGILPISGALIVTGTGFNTAGTNHWITRRSTDGGTTWTTVDVLPDSVAQADPVLDARGYLYIVGAVGAVPNRTPTIRRSTDGGVTWSSVDSLPTNTFGISAFRAINRASDGNLYALAQSVESTSVNHVVIRKLPCN